MAAFLPENENIYCLVLWSEDILKHTLSSVLMFLPNKQHHKGLYNEKKVETKTQFW